MNPHDLVGEELSDRVRLGEFRGTGSYGLVFEGDLLSLGRSVGRCAVKLFQVREGESAEAVLKAMRDYSRLLHPRLMLMQTSGAVRSGPAAGWCYQTMELAEMSLQDVLDQGIVMSVEDASTMLRQVAEALEYLHDQRLVHGEVRPANVLKSAAGGWKLSGLEFRKPQSDSLVEIGPTDHHFVFRSPEVLQEPTEEASVDMWALGVMAHAALTGRLPFPETPGLSRGDMIWRIIHREPEPERLPEPIDSVVRGCLRKASEDRWTARQVVDCLEGRYQPASEEADTLFAPANDVEVALGADALPPGPNEPSPPGERKPAVMVVALVVLALGLVMGLLLARDTPVPVPNVLHADLTQIPIKSVELDDRGRTSTISTETAALIEQIEGVPLTLVQINGGYFQMGSPTDERMRETDESPRHRVDVSTFFMGRDEVSQELWAVVATRLPRVARDLNPEPARNRGAELPVESISYWDALEFCARVSERTGRLHRLPTEAEWEYACRGGVTSTFSFGPTISTDVANFRGSRPYDIGQAAGIDRMRTTSIGYFPGGNAFGLRDMHGNLWEWCEDFYARYPGEAQVNPAGPETGFNHVVRGGGFRSYAWNCRCAARGNVNPSARKNDVGFRVVVPETILRSR